MILGIRPLRWSDLLGRRVRVTDPRGAKTRFAYDLLNRVIAVTDPLGQAVQFTYDPNSNLTSVTDPRGGQITYACNNMDQLTTRTDPLLRPETLGYDSGGNLTSFTDRKNQQTTWDAYDDLNRPTVVRFKNAAGVEVANLTYGFDAVSRLQTLTDSLAGQIGWDYDALDRLISETTPGNNVVTYVPDDADRRTSMTVSGQPQVSYTWDNADRLTQIARVGLNPAVFGYDNANRRTSLQLPNLVTIAYGYDDANRLTGLTYSGLVGGDQSLTHIYDPAGNRTLMGGSWARTLLPDAVASANYDAANRQLTLGTKTMTYDFNGNLSTVTQGANTITYTWDVFDRLTGMSGPTVSAAFAYDAADRRIQKTINGFSTTLQYDGWEVVKEVAGGATVSYLRDLAMDEPLARVEESGTTCYIPDVLGSIAALADSTGGVLTTYTYDTFGRTTATGAGSQNPFQFTGRENDATGLYHYRTRDYDPVAGRFLQEDPIGLEGGLNLYRYVRNNPGKFTDPLGLCEISATERGIKYDRKPFDAEITVKTRDKEGVERTITVPGSTWPDIREGNPGIVPGTYHGRYSPRGHRGRPGVQITPRMGIPTLGPNPGNPANFRRGAWEASGINLHCGGIKTQRGSAGCIVIRKDFCKKVWDALKDDPECTVTIERIPPAGP